MATENMKIKVTVDGAEEANQSLGDVVKNVAAIAVVVAAATKAIQFMGESALLLRADNKEFAKLEAVIKATGGSAGKTAEELGDLANQIQSTTGVSNTLLMQSEAMLLTFKEIGSEIFSRTLNALIDMSAVQGELVANTLALGKALNDPITGMTALSRVGVRFTDQQKEQVKVLQLSGDTLSAQKIILKELEGQFQGSAVAIAQNTEIMSAAFDDLRKLLARDLEPAIQEVAGAANEGITSFVETFNAEMAKISTEELEDLTRAFIAFGIVAGRMVNLSVQISNVGTDVRRFFLGLSEDILTSVPMLRRLSELFEETGTSANTASGYYEGYAEHLENIFGKLPEITEAVKAFNGAIVELPDDIELDLDMPDLLNTDEVVIAWNEGINQMMEDGRQFLADMDQQVIKEMTNKMRQASSIMSNLLFQAFDGSFDNIEDQFKNMLKRMLADFIISGLFNAISGGTYGGTGFFSSGGLFGNIFGGGGTDSFGGGNQTINVSPPVVNVLLGSVGISRAAEEGDLIRGVE